MNERIEKLIAQAREPLHNKDLPFNQGLMEYSEKLTELIVQECIDGLLKSYGPDECLPQEEIAVFLKKRFGVEK